MTYLQFHFVFLIPLLYVVFQHLREKLKPKPAQGHTPVASQSHT